MIGHVEGINPKILHECRIQSGFSLDEVEKRVSKIAEIEKGAYKPTFNQVENLSKLYSVPRWVFISEKLPEKFQFEKSITAFRQFSDANPEVFGNSKVRGLVTRIERYRSLILELSEDIDEAFSSFKPPTIDITDSAEIVAGQVRTWLNITKDRLSFIDWKSILEDKGVFIFLTSKYKGWSNIDRSRLRGLSIYHETLPIIIINNSDAKKAQTFTLFHELGHILRKENSIDDWILPDRDEETWCDDLAGNVLLPKESFLQSSSVFSDYTSLKAIASSYGVSSYAALVRLRRFNIIGQDTYKQLEENILDEWEKIQQSFKEKDGGPARNRPNEVLQQFGGIYTRVLFQAFYNKEIGLHKLTKLLELKRPTSVFEIEARL